MATDIEKILRIRVEGEDTVAGLKKEIKDLQDILLNVEKGTEDYDKVNKRLTEDLDRLAETQGKTSAQMQSAQNIANGTATTMKELNAVIKAQQDALVGLEQGSEEWKAVEQQLADNIAKRTQIMAAGKSQFAEHADSLKGLRLELKNLTQEYDSLSKADRESAEGLKLKDKINDVTKTLKSAEEGTGRFYRNVGNYTNSIVEAFGKMGGGASAIINPIKNVNGAMKVLSANPFMAVAGLLVTVLTRLGEAFKRNETAMASIQKVAAPFKAIMVEIEKVFDTLVGTVVKVAEVMGNVLGKLFGGEQYEKTKQQLQEIADQELQLSQQQRDTIMQNADAENEVAELRAKSAEKNKYTAAERLEFLKQAGEKEKEIAERAYEDLKLQYEIIKQKNSLTKSSAEDLKAEADAYAAMVGAKTNYLNKTREINAQIAEAQNSEKGQYTALLNAQKATIQAQIEVVEKGSEEELKLRKELAEKEYEIAVTSAKQNVKDKKTLNAQLEALAKKKNRTLENLEIEHTKFLNKQYRDRREIELNGMVQGTSDYFKKMYELRKAERDDIVKIGKLQNETVEEYHLRIQAADEKMRQSIINYAKMHREEELSDLQLFATNAKEGSVEEATALAEIARLRLQFLENDKDNLKVLGLTEKQYAQLVAEATKEYNKALDTQIETEEAFNEEKKRLAQQRMDNLATEAVMTYGETDMATYEARLAAAQYYYDHLEILQNESAEDFRARQLAAEKEITDIQNEQIQQRISNYSNLASSIATIMSDVASYYKEEIEAEVESGKISEREGERRFKTIKAMEIAVATINMLQGITTALSGVFTTKTGPWDVALAAAQAASIAVNGGIQISKIRSTTLSSNGSTDTAVNMSAPSVSLPDYTPQTVQNLTGDSEMTTLANALTDNPIRAIVVESDITNKQNKRKQREAEATF